MSTLLHLPFNQESPLTNVIYDQSDSGTALAIRGAVGLSEAQSKFRGVSGYFNGSGAYIEVGSLPAFATGDFTIALWVYIDTSTNSRFLVDFRPAYTNGAYPSLSMGGGNTVNFWHTALNRISGTVVLATGWHHVAVCRALGSTRLFIDGVQDGATYADTTNYLSGGDSRPRIGSGGYYTPEATLKGYVDDLIIADTALYTTTFTPEEIAYTPRSIVTSRSDDLICIHAYDVPDAKASRCIATRGNYPLYYNGRACIAATVAVKGSPNIPVSRRVRLHEQVTGNFVAETWSDNAGNYMFEYIDPSCIYYAVAFDHTGAYRGVIADNLVPELM